MLKRTPDSCSPLAAGHGERLVLYRRPTGIGGISHGAFDAPSNSTLRERRAVPGAPVRAHNARRPTVLRGPALLVRIHLAVFPNVVQAVLVVQPHFRVVVIQPCDHPLRTVRAPGEHSILRNDDVVHPTLAADEYALRRNDKIRTIRLLIRSFRMKAEQVRAGRTIQDLRRPLAGRFSRSAAFYFVSLTCDQPILRWI